MAIFLPMLHKLRFTFYVLRFTSYVSRFTSYALRITFYVLRFTSYVSRFTLHQFDAGLLLAAILTLFAIQPLLKPGLPTTADLMIHLVRTLEYEQAWAPGVIAPRWAPNLAYGYGYPLFVFAPPLPYLLGLLLQWPGFSLETAFKLLIIVTFLLYAIGMYLLVRDLFGSVEAGLVAAAAYTFAPFALREALLYGGNIPQFLAIGLFPWPLWAIRRAGLQANGWGWIVLAALCYAAIILSHLFQVLIFSPVFSLYILLLFVIVKNDQKQPAIKKLVAFSRPFAALLLGLLLSAFFWIPAFIERGYTRAQADVYLVKSPFFVRYPHWTELVAWIEPLDFRAANPYAPLTLGVITLILAGLGILRGMSIFRGPVRYHHLILTSFFALTATGAIFMSLPASQAVWRTVEILQVAEFPWRMLGLANLGLAVLAGLAILWVPQPGRPFAAALCLAVQLFAVAPYLYPVTAFTRHGDLAIADQINYERSSQSVGTTTLGEYLPQSVARPPTTSPLVEAFQANHYPERLDQGTLPEQGAATLLEQTAITHRYQLNSPVPFTLRLFQFDFPGWRADLDGQPVEIRPEAETGLILIDIPAGQHILTVHFGETPSRLLGLGLTGLSLISLAILAIRRLALAGREKGAGGLNLPARLPLPSPFTWAAFIGIMIAALWLKPLLQPLFTVSSPREQALPAQYPANIRFANGIQLVGYDLSRRVVQPGGYLQVALYWQTGSAPYRVNLQPFVHLDRLDNFTTIADATNYTPGDVTTEMNMPTFHWDNHRYIRDEHDLFLPAGTPPLAYAVRVGLIDPEQQGRLVSLAGQSGDTAWLDTINIAPAGHPAVAPAQPLDIMFSNDADTIHLTGFEITALTPAQLDFKLAWQTKQKLQADYTIFAQLLAPDGRLVASFDRPPLDGAYPTATWLPNQTILDPRHIPLVEVPAGDYTLIVGLYDPATGRRLTTTGGADFARLTTVTITHE